MFIFIVIGTEMVMHTGEVPGRSLLVTIASHSSSQGSTMRLQAGGIRDKILQIILEAMDSVVGTENSTWLEYLLWMIFDSFTVGGVHRATASTGSRTKVVYHII